MSFFASATARIVTAVSEIDPQPTLPPAYTGDPDLITPGWIGFSAMFLIAIVTILLILDMTRRVRRTRYRGEIREMLEAEAAEAAAGSSEDAGAGTGSDRPNP